jgi:hypothetical protein
MYKHIPPTSTRYASSLNSWPKSRTFAFLRFHVTTRAHATMAAQFPMFIIRRAEYFQYNMLYINFEIGSRSSDRIVTH